MIIVIVGTRAQWIKMAPVWRELELRNLPRRLIVTGQHAQTVEALRQDFEIPPPDAVLFTGGEASSSLRMLRWLLSSLWVGLKERQTLLGPAAQAKRPLILVHGDTFSTLLGALLGQVWRIPVAHVESGLRSFRWFHPFPEELTRLAVFRLSRIGFCPGPWAAENLRRFPLQAVNTVENTLLDALRMALQKPPADPLPAAPYAVCSIHRFENIFRRSQLDRVMGLVEQIAARIPLQFVLHPATERQLERHGWRQRFADNPAIHLRPRMSYFSFMHLLSGANLVVTDGGSNQEELAYLGIPTLLMRDATERQEGLGDTAMLSNYDPQRISDFLDRHAGHTPQLRTLPEVYPSATIAEFLQRWLQG